MSLTLEDKTRLMLAYEPHLVLFERDAVQPPHAIRSFLEGSALWSEIWLGDNPRPRRRQLFWGTEVGVPGFPRAPQVFAGDLELGGVDFEDNFRVQVDAENFPLPSRFFFLSTEAWEPEGTPLTPLEPLSLSIDTPVRSANIPGLRTVFGHRTDDAGAAVGSRAAANHRYSAEVLEFREAYLGVDPDPFFGDALSGLGLNPLMIFYYYMFPTHEEFLSLAEAAALQAALAEEESDATVGEVIQNYLDFLETLFSGAEEVPPGLTPSMNEVTEPVFGVQTKSYAGDMQCICVVVPSLERDGDGDPIVPPTDELPDPVVVGYGRRLRSLRDETDLPNGDTSRSQQQMRAALTFEADGRHPVAYVAAGTHNFYVSPGEEGRWPLNETASGEPVPTVSPEDVPDQGGGGRQNAAVWPSIMKFLTMDLFSALASSLQEAGSEGVEVPGTGQSGEEPGSDAEDVVPTAPDADGAVRIVSLEAATGAATERVWRQDVPADALTEAERDDVVQADQGWWPHPPDSTLVPSDGFEGRWGVAVVDDPFDARRGERFPNYRVVMLDALERVS